ncbi:SPOR domain-containing protein [Roseivirga sp. BDSF3-8]|uniref:SPOR domain-containing protein n=1 Tax=Roseivirga sp. BDSF3-8 TaxID=3241598 RepID=UPI00353260C4
MKHILAILALMAFIAVAPEAKAQLSKKEKKEWKKKMKAMEPAEFKELVETNSSLESEVSELRGKVDNLQNEVQTKEERISTAQNQARQAQAELAEAREQLKALEEDASENETRTANGVVFKVQVGAYKNKDLAQYNDNSDNFSSEEEGGLQRITLGNFRDYWEADTFKKYLREMGVKDAWVVPYKDGQRVPMKDVLEGVI